MSFDVIEYQNLDPIDKLRWHLKHDCICGFLENPFEPAEHYSNCPLSDPNDEGWDYATDYGIIPQG